MKIFTVTSKKAVQYPLVLAVVLALSLTAQAADNASPRITSSTDVKPAPSLTDKESQAVSLAAGRVGACGPLVEMLTRLDLAPAGSEEALAVIEATVSGIDSEYHLTRLAFAGGGEGRELWLPGDGLTMGRRVRLAVHARDVSLTLQPPRQSSILNIIPVQVDALSSSGPAQVMVRLQADEVPLLARVTRKSEAALGLHVGQALFAQVKSVSLVE